MLPQVFPGVLRHTNEGQPSLCTSVSTDIRCRRRQTLWDSRLGPNQTAFAPAVPGCTRCQPDLLLPLHLVLCVPFHVRAAGHVGEGLWKSPPLCNQNIHLYSKIHGGICIDTWSQPLVRIQVQCNATKGVGEKTKQCTLFWGWFLYLVQDILIFWRDLGQLLIIISTTLCKDLVFLKRLCLALADPGRQKQMVWSSWGRREPIGDIFIQTTTKKDILLCKLSQT